MVIAKPSASSVVGWLNEGDHLTLLAMSVVPVEGIKYLIWSVKQDAVALFPGADFDVVDKNQSSRWVFSNDLQGGGFDLGPEAWQVNGLWERCYEGDAVAEQVFVNEMSLISSESDQSMRDRG